MKFLHSNSAHEAVDTCRAKFYLLQTGAPRRGESQRLAFGRTFHRFAELYRNHCIKAERWSDIEAISELTDDAIRECGLSTERYEEIHMLARRFATNERIDIERSLMREGGVALDAHLQPIPWDDDLEYDSPQFKAAGSRAAVRMKFDELLIDPPTKIILLDDWKTDFHVPSQTEITDQSGRWWKQAHLYAWGAVTYVYPDAAGVEFRFKFVRWNVTRTLFLTREAIDAFAEIFVRKIRFVEALEAFPASPGPHCADCPFFRGACPLKDPLTFDDYADDLEEIAARYLYDEAVQETRKGLLKERAGAGGSVMVGGLPVALFEKVERRVLDVQKALDAMRAEGIDGPQYLLDISPSKLKDKLDADQFERVMKAASQHDEDAVIFNVHQNKPELIALAESLGIQDAKKMRVAQLALAIAKATSQQAA